MLNLYDAQIEFRKYDKNLKNLEFITKPWGYEATNVKDLTLRIIPDYDKGKIKKERIELIFKINIDKDIKAKDINKLYYANIQISITDEFCFLETTFDNQTTLKSFEAMATFYSDYKK